jgi:Protein of unknown function (DUF3750)
MSMRTIIKFLTRFLLILVVIPIAIGTVLNLAHGWPANWRQADWSSSHVLPLATASTEAEVIILASRTGRWKGIFSEHMSLVLKPAGATQWTRYDVVGWDQPVRKDAYVADAFWYGNTPRVIYDVKGDNAAALIPAIETSISKYPYSARGSYTIVPGPNSNTFVSWVVRHTEGFDAELSSVAVGKDYLGPGFQTARAPSDSGYTVSVDGYLALTIAREEGIELGLIGSTIGIDFNDLAVKLPALGKLSLIDLLHHSS